ncbi:MAG: nodV1, partial [Verrucomicrobiales bacterium]|nr:nodV1 [Verrucomicrobiales bacterium]
MKGLPAKQFANNIKSYLVERPLDERHASALWRYGVAALYVAIAFGIRFALSPLVGSKAVFILFIPAIIIIAWRAGLGPALFASISAFFLANYFFIAPAGTWSKHYAAESVAGITYIFTAFAAAWWASALRSERKRVIAKANESMEQAKVLQRELKRRQQAEEQLATHAQKLRLSIDTIPTMAWIILPDGTMEFINQRWLAYSGLSLEQALEQPTRTVHPDDLPRALEKWSVNNVSGDPYEDEMRLRRADGEYRWFLIRTVPLRDEHGTVIRWYGTSTDIQDRKLAEKALRETQAVLARVARSTVVGELTASIAHEVNQPLAAVVTNAGAALRWLDGQPPNLNETREALQRIVRDGNRASEVILRIRALLKNDAPIKTQINLGETIAEIIALTETEAQRRQVSVQTQMASDLPRVTADRVQLQQVLMNLTMNALDALSEVIDRSRILTIEVEMDSPNTVLVAVHDTGIGIDPERMKQIFEPFHTTKTHGLGLGLSISRSIIE